MYVQWASDQSLLRTNTCVWEFLLQINTTQYSNGTCALHIPPGPRRSHCGPIIVLWVEGMWTNVVLVKLDINSLGGVLVTLDISSCTVTRWIVVGVVAAIVAAAVPLLLLLIAVVVGGVVAFFEIDLYMHTCVCFEISS